MNLRFILQTAPHTIHTAEKLKAAQSLNQQRGEVFGEQNNADGAHVPGIPEALSAEQPSLLDLCEGGSLSIPVVNSDINSAKC